ncbi:uncharacterized protein N7496_000192 [Penicillium cataractarum]|uniref:Uncharacterized protein n=1 Tax=Penicillium cataractarum TaxID=2100454 RepID=A0A9W9VTU9_9EURO|nr:uncharacterized protein N7496_000192 [Penicillium cataractarum]KAJ5389124.1 hypothetical protein N7496_000192 [Penicillium cataractarum]
MTLNWKIRGTITYASIALDGLLFFLLLGLTVATWVLHRQRRFNLDVLPTKTLIGSLVAWALAECFWAVSLAFGYLLLPSEFFYDLGITVLFYVFYALLHGLVEVTTGTKNGYPKTKLFHWGLVGIIAVAGIVEWVLYVMTVVYASNFEFWSMVWKITDTASMIIRWLVSWEILAWSIVLVIKTVKLRADVMVPSLLYAVACVFFCVNWFTWTCFDIVSYVVLQYTMSNTGVNAIRIVQVIMCACWYPSILICCLRWGMIHRGLVDRELINEVKWPSSGAVEADSGIPTMEVDSKPIVEVDSSNHIVEAAESRPVAELDSRPVPDRTLNV